MASIGQVSTRYFLLASSLSNRERLEMKERKDFLDGVEVW